MWFSAKLLLQVVVNLCPLLAQLLLHALLLTTHGQMEANEQPLLGGRAFVIFSRCTVELFESHLTIGSQRGQALPPGHAAVRATISFGAPKHLLPDGERDAQALS